MKPSFIIRVDDTAYIMIRNLSQRVFTANTSRKEATNGANKYPNVLERQKK